MSNIQQVKNTIATRQVRPMSPAVAEVRGNINLMVEVMKSCMVKDMHFGTIPGVQKPSLFKAGAEKIMATFRLSANPIVEDLSKDGEIRFRVKVEMNAKDGSFVGAGIGECSSQEEKYMWRAAVCQEEFDITDETKRRVKFKKSYGGGIEKINQVRCNPSDLANTILKMAKKRALVDGVLTATGASDLFSQDIEDLPAEYVDSMVKTTQKAEVVPSQPQQVTAEPKAEATPEPDRKPQSTGDKLAALRDGESLLEYDGVVASVSSRTVKTKSGDKIVSAYVLNNGVKIEKWGDPHPEYAGKKAFFFSVKAKEYNGMMGYMADKIECAVFQSPKSVEWEA